MLQSIRQKQPSGTLHNENGQSAVEYLVICTALVTLVLISSSQDSVYNMISHTIHNKYSSYAFGVSIADPPSKAFDDAVTKDITKAKQVLHDLENIGDVIGDLTKLNIADELEKDISSMDKKIMNGVLTLWDDIKSLF